MGRLTTAAAAAAVLTVLVAGGCGSGGLSSPGGGAETASFPVVITDGLGRQVTVAAEPQRIVSLAPANTEILFALGLGPKVVGVTDYCDYPPEALTKEKVGGFYDPNLETVLSLEPDLIFAAGGVQEPIVNQLESLGQTVIALDPHDLDDVFASIELAGRATGQAEKAEDMVASMQERTRAVRQKLESANAAPVDTFIVVWIEDAGITTAGPDTFVSNLVELAGGRNIAADVQGDYPQFSLEKLLEDDPEVIISTDHQYDNPQEVEQVLKWGQLKAVKDDRVYVVSDADLLTLPGPRIVDGLEYVAHCLHPDLFAAP